jgi:nicotinamide riboside transporter PnuC
MYKYLQSYTTLDYLLFIVTLVSIWGVVLNIYKDDRCFIIWIFSNSIWLIVDFWKGIPAQGCLFTVYVLLAIWGFTRWKKRKKGENDVKE